MPLRLFQRKAGVNGAAPLVPVKVHPNDFIAFHDISPSLAMPRVRRGAVSIRPDWLFHPKCAGYHAALKTGFAVQIPYWAIFLRLTHCLESCKRGPNIGRDCVLP
jgi:hypothetical protein